ncbi:N-acetyl-1-D-myo-inositol-2-amino-2-deoxy-alpha-D-glucopyranoside deacetylase [Blastococcus sp. TF02-8]|uniref:N-acetyl-1-D-myo-inositol-2-amino-2-deoxy-alpha- D-glucopyranoside deacetylase n=1 Tax=Blastococcus sp. TF02-8 TaxID=2250574 RepID=UPI000DEB1B06|nr:N-acetyl-1-D-myo-inositol-2-amino-2-deoxy-alpha-D-glucopyranoside deacetylase [Blastococcus sp. TF02-8]RBY95975.1 N-acetyl-1-D-myo-inositol-2-amino-2-deoxy-alpha-D-glucopyranoside deacetylase [Blastococcus sp. TF02-8]
MTANRRLLLVHAHPDDESITTGATMARYAAEGAQVTLLTCTLGEEGEILVPELAQLAADQADQLGGYRIAELRAAMAALGVTDIRFLGGAGHYRDSGMIGTPANARARAFWNADLDAAAAHAVAVVRDVRPQVVVTYDPDGGYGHPDHIQAHRVAMRAVDLAADAGYRPDLGPAWDVAKVYWCRLPRTAVRESDAALAAAGERVPFLPSAAIEHAPFVVDDDEVTAVVDAADLTARKSAALAAHATQITVREGFFALSNHLGQLVRGTEWFQLVRGVPAVDGSGRETDLFAGLPR